MNNLENKEIFDKFASYASYHMRKMTNDKYWIKWDFEIISRFSVHFWTFQNFLKTEGYLLRPQSPIFVTYSRSSFMWLIKNFSKKKQNADLIPKSHLIVYLSIPIVVKNK